MAKFNLSVANQTQMVTSPSFKVSRDNNGIVVATLPIDFSGYHAIYINSVSGAGSSYQKGFIALPDEEESEKFNVSSVHRITFKKSANGIDIYGYSSQRPDAGSTYSVNITLY